MDIKKGVLAMKVSFILILISLVAMSIFITLIVLLIRVLLKYGKSKEVREEKNLIKKSLSQALKEERLKCKMTQEFVAEALGVSRQAVSKWESAASEPSTTNLLALAKLYGISAEELLKSVI